MRAQPVTAAPSETGDAATMMVLKMAVRVLGIKAQVSRDAERSPHHR